MFPKKMKCNLHYAEVRGDVLRPPDGTNAGGYVDEQRMLDCMDAHTDLDFRHKSPIPTLCINYYVTVNSRYLEVQRTL